MAEQDKEQAPVTWGTPDMYQGTSSGDISRDIPTDLSSASTAGPEDFFKLPPQQNPLSPAYTYTPSTPPTPPPPNLANDPTMSGSGQVSLPPAPNLPPPGAAPPAPPMGAGPMGAGPMGAPPVPPTPPSPPPYTPPTSPVPTGPLPTNQFAAGQIGLLEQKKQLYSNEAENLSKGQAEAARIQSEASAQDKARMEGDPVALLKAQQDHAAAMKLPDSDPNKRALLQKSEFDIRSNEGARSALLRAQMDAERRDNEIRAMIKKAQAEKIDPDRYWAHKGTGGRIMAGIGMLLSGMGSGMSGQPNLAVQQINNAIDRDIRAQAADIDNNWKAIAEQNNLNNTAFNRELHRQTWENNYRTAALERVKLDLASNAARTESETVRNKAREGIVDLTNEQLKIRNEQYLVAVRAQAAELARIRNLQKEAQADVMKLVEKEGVSVEQAERTIYSSPRYSDIMSRAPAHVQQEALQTNALVAQYKIDAAKAEQGAKTLGLKPGTKQFDAYMKENDPKNDPKYQRLFTGERATPIGAVVGPDMNKKLTAEEKRLDIQKKETEIKSQEGEKKALGDVYSRALAYQNYFSSPQEGDITARLGATKGVRDKIYPKGSAYENNVNAWNAFVDTTMVPIMEKKINQGKAGEQAIKIGGEAYHISVDMTDTQKKQRMQSAVENLGEAMTIAGVNTKELKPGNVSGLPKAPVTEYDPVTKQPIKKAE